MRVRGSNLVNDWLKSSTLNSSESSIDTSNAQELSQTQLSISEGFEKVSRKATVEHKQALESVIFEEKGVDVAVLGVFEWFVREQGGEGGTAEDTLEDT